MKGDTGAGTEDEALRGYALRAWGAGDAGEALAVQVGLAGAEGHAGACGGRGRRCPGAWTRGSQSDPWI